MNFNLLADGFHVRCDPEELCAPACKSKNSAANYSVPSYLPSSLSFGRRSPKSAGWANKKLVQDAPVRRHPGALFTII